MYLLPHVVLPISDAREREKSEQHFHFPFSQSSPLHSINLHHPILHHHLAHPGRYHLINLLNPNLDRRILFIKITHQSHSRVDESHRTFSRHPEAIIFFVG